MLRAYQKDDDLRPDRAGCNVDWPTLRDVTIADPADLEASARARAWHHAAHAAVCDVIEPWAHGTVARATRYPSYWDYNVVRVEDDPGLGVDELESLADEALAELAHRRVDFELAEAAEPLRAGFENRGWLTMRLLWMRHEATRPTIADALVHEVPYDAVNDLRVAWHREDFPDQDATGYLSQAREVAEMRHARVLALHEAGVPVAFTQLVREGAASEITHVYVHPERRGAGRGTAITRAAIAAVGDAQELWICADDEDRPKHLYARLGFRPVWTSLQFTRLPR
jgi:GNAT superfamily N-acetyltransferase